MKKKVLVLCPQFTSAGGRCGVSYYYSLVKKYFASERVSVDFYYTGKNNSNNKNRQNRIIKSFCDLFSLIRAFPLYDLVVLNPSLDAKAVIRDGVYHALAKRIFRRKTLVFFRGWKSEFEQMINNYGKSTFKFCFNFDRALVLSKQFKKRLVQWGFSPETVRLETTAFEQHEYQADKNRYNIIFLSRLIKNKGCLEAIQTAEIVINEFPNVKLFMVGDGPFIPELKEYVDRHNLGKNVEFTGWLKGKEKYCLINQCSIMLLPSYSEGMPNSLLEGMGMGLAIVSTPVGGIPEIIVNGENGFLIDSFRPGDFAEKLKLLIENKDVWQAISSKNKKLAGERFEIRNIVKRLERLYFEMAQ